MRYITTTLVAAAMSLFVTTASAEQVTVAGQTFQVDVQALCLNGDGVFSNGVTFRVLDRTSGDIWFNGEELKLRRVCPIVAPAVHHGGGSDGPNFAANDNGAAFRDEGKGGALGDNEQNDQGGGTTTKGNGAPPAAGGNN